MIQNITLKEQNENQNGKQKKASVCPKANKIKPIFLTLLFTIFTNIGGPKSPTFYSL